MGWLCLLLIPVACAISAPLCVVLMRLGHRFRTLDGPGVAGQVKEPARRVPNTGGIAIVAGFLLPVAVLLGVAHAGDWLLDAVDPIWPAAGAALREHAPGLRLRTPLALVLLGCVAALHVVGVIDDRRPLGPWVKLGVILAAGSAVAITDQTRLLTLLDAHVGGAWLSILVTVLWIGVVTNALNFMDNMDGLSAGAALCAASCFLGAAMVNQQWFIAGLLCLLIGSLLGFLLFNMPPARLFMGDGGSLVIGFILAVLTVRTTYYAPDAGIEGGGAWLAGSWHVVFMPVIILAVPLYDLVSVVVIRLWQGRNPLVGDLQHLSHRLVKRGLSKRGAVLVIWGFTLVTGIAGITLASLEPWQGVLVFVQTALLLGVIGALEYASSEAHRIRRGERGD